MRAQRSTPSAGPKSPASKNRAGVISYPFSLQALDEAIESAARMRGGAAAAPRRNDEFSSERKPISASRGGRGS
jgi:hypothetical protein